MSHFARADETDKTFSLQQIDRFRQVIEVTRHYGIEVRHMKLSPAYRTVFRGSSSDRGKAALAVSLARFFRSSASGARFSMEQPAQWAA
jgi:hypothetical protein